MKSAAELIQQLNYTDECNWIEAKRGSAIDRSILESVCAFSNEPGLGGGYILLGVEQEELSLFPTYYASGVEQSDKIQLDLSTQCASMFNQPIRPTIQVESVNGKNVIVAYVPELPDGQKPAYFRNENLPQGAYRRIGSSDQRCTDDDLFVFFNKEDSFDSALVSGSSLDDISEEALALYRQLRGKVNAFAEELQYNDEDLLYSLGCIRKEKGKIQLTYAGLLLFGKRIAHRRLLPMVRVDYVRVPGNEWMEDPENRFTTIDMRGSLLEMVQRVFSQITDDLPKGFVLPEGELQAESIGLPTRVLREAIVNALIHRTYRENQPIQIIRYGNRIEIKNPGFSLKPEDHLGEPGSKSRNPFIAAVFHETNLAETKGSGVRTMRALMEKANLLPPTFESDHGRNQFTVRLLLHHFLGTDDVQWLSTFEIYGLNEDQKRALIFTREVGAIDNSSYRQLNGVDILKASSDLRDMRIKELLDQKGKGRATYYVVGKNFVSGNEAEDSKPPVSVSAPVDDLKTPPPGDSEPPLGDNEPPLGDSEPPRKGEGAKSEEILKRLPQELISEIPLFRKRIQDKSLLADFICRLCEADSFQIHELSIILNKTEKYLLFNFIKPLREKGMLEYTIPDMPNHFKQAYRAVKK
ncbi:ATP-binding protein [Olivibacter sitiensis]|uniref:ATP-binding protein n=1 Tax=Olivibacter sitiensis TaxID=376470 RepID=UPI00041DB621|nr:ATP-binding protein [Olivibacter sitiensis]